MNILDEPDREVLVLENILQRESRVHQRDLAEILGVSLGMTNAILKRLVNKGWLTIKKLNNRNVHYIVSADGIEEIAKRSYRYFKRTIRNVVHYKGIIEDFIRKIRNRGYLGVVIIGKSDIEFIVEHVCLKVGLRFDTKKPSDILHSESVKSRIFYLYDENYYSGNKKNERENCAFLRDLVT